MDGRRFIRSISLRNILSFGPDTPELPLEPLNVLIGPNASGKSNLIEALSLLAAAPRDLQAPIREGGGVHEWLWKGAESLGIATIDATVNHATPSTPLTYRLGFKELARHVFYLDNEMVHSWNSEEASESVYYVYVRGTAVINTQTQSSEPTQESKGKPGPRFDRNLETEEVIHDQSILSQRNDPFSYPELTYLRSSLLSIGFYREWNLSRLASLRQPQQADLPKSVLTEDASNLGIVLSDLLNRPTVRSRILDKLRVFYPSIEDIRTDITGGLVQIFLHERGLHHPIPAVRLSDGTLRYLCLLAVLCHPQPPLVTCIEEPELGLHPDVVPEVAKLLVEASTRTQLFVTTHSDILVDALSDTPEAIIVCEKTDGSTQLQRLNAEELKPWLEKYRLGELWTSGHIGGNRW